MINLFDIVTPANVAYYYDKSLADQTAYLGDKLFPVKKIAGLELNKVSGSAGLPVALTESAFDTQATYRDRLSIEIQKSKMPFFREAMKIDETLRQQIVQLSNDTVAKTYISQIFDDTNNLIRGAKVARERMAMELISTGKVNLNGNGVHLEYDYHLNKKQFTKASIKWTNSATANPIQDIADMVDQFNRDFRVKLKYAVMTTATFNLIKSAETTRKALYPTATDAKSVFVVPAQVKELVANATGVTILTYDEVYAKEVGGIAHPLFPDNVVTFLPARRYSW